MARADLFVSEGGPVSYCLPYSRAPLRHSVVCWSEAVTVLVERADAAGGEAHLETFGGCLLGQLCPPSMLVSMSLLEALFFVQHGVRSVSLSYAQQTDPAQDIAALEVLRLLASQLIPQDVDHQIVLYTHMGVFPRTTTGARSILRSSAEIARAGGAGRLVVKTTAEAHRLPTVNENIAALRTAHEAYRCASKGVQVSPVEAEMIFDEATRIIDAVLNTSPDIGRALVQCFAAGRLDIPFCLHPDNRNAVSAAVDQHGRLRWNDVGRLPIRRRSPSPAMHAALLLDQLTHASRAYDQVALGTGRDNRSTRPPGPSRRIAIVGSGPRGLAVFERLAARLATRPPGVPIEIVLIDALEVGCGRVWRTDQPEHLLMNTAAGEVTIYSGDADDGPARAGAGPTLAEWWEHHDRSAVDPLGCAPRVIYGRYLLDALAACGASLPDGVTLRRVKDEVLSVYRMSDGFELELRSRTTETAEAVVLATGHSTPRLGPAEEAHANFAARHPPCRYLRDDSAADLPLPWIPSAATVGIIGLGLGFYDVVASLTLGRGGRFSAHRDGRLRYHASGREPRIAAGSRSGLPLLARGLNQKSPRAVYVAKIFTPWRMAEARQERPLDFDMDVLPVLMAEVELVFCSTALRSDIGARAALGFDATAVRYAKDYPPRDAVKLAASDYGVADLLPLDRSIALEVERAWGIRVRAGYGQTETTALLGELPGERNDDGWLRTLPGYTFRLLDPDGAESTGTGELCLDLNKRPIGLMAGYLEGGRARTPVRSGEAVYRTGDLAERAAEGRIRLLGRVDDVFKAFGHRVSPYEIEAVILEHEGVLATAVVPRAHVDGGIAAHAVVVPSPQAGPDLLTELLAESLSRFGPERAALTAELAGELPRTRTGKVTRRVLWPGGTSGLTTLAPTTDGGTDANPTNSRRVVPEVRTESVTHSVDITTLRTKTLADQRCSAHHPRRTGVATPNTRHRPVRDHRQRPHRLHRPRPRPTRRRNRPSAPSCINWIYCHDERHASGPDRRHATRRVQHLWYIYPQPEMVGTNYASLPRTRGARVAPASHSVPLGPACPR